MIKTMKALLIREYWEHRGAFIKTPIIIGIVLMVISIGGYITALFMTEKSGSTDLINTLMLESSNLNPKHIALFWDSQMLSISSLYLVVLFFVLFFFLLGSLFDDRKDQSILFWKSLPVSDSITVASKLITALFVVPLIYVAVFVLVTLVFMALFSVILLIHGMNPWTLIWSNSNVFSGASVMLSGVLAQMVWSLPIYGWLMFASSFSKRKPFLFAVFVPAIISFAWYWTNVLTFKFSEFGLSKEIANYLGHALLPYASGSMHDGSFHFNIEDNSSISPVISNIFSSFDSIEILYGALFAAVSIALSIWIRRFRNTT